MAWAAAAVQRRQQWRQQYKVPSAIMQCSALEEWCMCFKRGAEMGQFIQCQAHRFECNGYCEGQWLWDNLLMRSGACASNVE